MTDDFQAASTPRRQAIALRGHELVSRGLLVAVATAVKGLLDRDPEAIVLIYDAATSEPIELDLRGTLEEVLARLDPPVAMPTRGPGRPKLGVVGREVTLLPAHWDWLQQQRGGASVTLRSLVEAARRRDSMGAHVRRARDAAYRFMSQVGGDLAGFEEASRALFAGNAVVFGRETASWPSAVRDHVHQLAEGAFDA